MGRKMLRPVCVDVQRPAAGSLFYGPLRGVGEKGDKVLHGVYRDELGAKKPSSMLGGQQDRG